MAIKPVQISNNMKFINIQSIPGQPANFLTRVLTMIDGAQSFTNANMDLFHTVEEKYNLLKYDAILDRQHQSWLEFEFNLIQIYYNTFSELDVSNTIFVQFNHYTTDVPKIGALSDVYTIKFEIKTVADIEFILNNSLFKNTDIKVMNDIRKLNTVYDYINLDDTNMINIHLHNFLQEDTFTNMINDLCDRMSIKHDIRNLDYIIKLWKQWITTISVEPVYWPNYYYYYYDILYDYIKCRQ